MNSFFKLLSCLVAFICGQVSCAQSPLHDLKFETGSNNFPIQQRARFQQASNLAQQVESKSSKQLPDFEITPHRYFAEPHPEKIELQSSIQFPSTQMPAVPRIYAKPANQQTDGENWIAPYRARAEFDFAPDEIAKANQTRMQPIPADYKAWWTQKIMSPMGRTRRNVVVSLDSLIHGALKYSPNIQLAATRPQIRQTVLFEEAAQFDWRSFLDTRYDDLNDPIGNELTTGNNSTRFKQREWSGRTGLRRRNQVGGEVELSQRLGYLDNNSRFLVPPNQGNARLELNYRQPLLNGRGRAVNESLVVLADIDFHAASDELLGQLQLQLVKVTEAYWELFRARAALLQRQKLLDGGEQILNNLEGRARVDALERQILRARAAVANRRAEIARAVTSIRNAESKLRRLVNDPALINAAGAEYTPAETPSERPFSIEMSDALSTALTYRSDISIAIRDLRAANVRLGVAKNEVLPKLDLLLGTYVAGLDGESDVFDAWTKQYKEGRPGFNVGFEFEFPIGNRAARARKQGRQWELTRALFRFRAVVESSLTEVELAVREVNTSYKEMLGRYHAMVAADKETRFLVDRWKTLPGIDDSVTLLLENLLDSQERLADEEAAFVKAQVDYSVATVKLKQTMGTLFQINQN